MGACYTVNLKVGFSNEENEKEATKALCQFVHSKRANFSLDRWAQIGGKLDTFDDLVKVIFAGHQNPGDYDFDIKNGWYCHSHDFDASYGWEGVLIDMFELITPYIADKSELFIDIDNDYDQLVIKNGKCVQIH